LLPIINFLNATGMLLGSLLGSQIISNLEITASSYYLLFSLSTVGRLCSVLILPYLKEPPKTGAKKEQIFWRIVGLRPNFGIIVRPILSLSKKKRSKKATNN